MKIKRILEAARPFLLPVLVCAALVTGQCVCDFSILNGMNDIAQRGIGQSGLEAGTPEALSAQGMALLENFMSSEDAETIDGIYNTFEPESSEAARFAEKYPLAEREAVCVLREDVTDEGMVLGGEIYEKAAGAFVLYMQREAQTHELDEVASFYAALHAPKQESGEYRENIRDFTDTESLPEGALGSISEDTLFAIPQENSIPEESGNGEETGKADSAEESAADADQDVDADEPTEQESFALPEDAGVGNINMERIYSYLPLLAQVPQESIDAAIAEAADAPEFTHETGIQFKKLLYQELGMDTGRIRSAYIWRVALRIFLTAVLSAALAFLAGLVIDRVAFFLTGRTLKLLVSVGLRAFIYAVVMSLGGIVVAVQNVSLSGGTAAAAYAVGIAVGIACLAVINAPTVRARLPLAEKLLFNSRSLLPKALLSVSLPVLLLVTDMLSVMIIQAGVNAAAVPFFARIIVAFAAYATAAWLYIGAEREM